MSNWMQAFATAPRTDMPQIRPGDTVRVHNRIVEGEQERVQVFQGVVMRMSGSGAQARFTVRRIAAHGVGVERTFFATSPRLEKVEIVRQSHVRRAQLYYLRGRRGKAARLRAKRYLRPDAESTVEEAEAPVPSGTVEAGTAQ
jgi:large subunit ribosomal protein L19